MIHSQSKLTSQGQVSVPAAVRHALGLAPGSVLEWVEERGRIVVKRAVRHNSQEVRDVLFEGSPPAGPAPSSADLKQGIAQHMKRRHARG